MTNVPPPDYDGARHSQEPGAHVAPTAPAFPPPFAPAPVSAPPPSPTPRRSPGKRVLGVIAAIALVLAPAVIGYEVGQSNDSSTGPSAINLPSSNQPTNDPQSGSSNGSTSNSSGSGTAGGFDVDAIADKADDSVININTLLDPEGAAAGTGILISSSGLAITNNHVINNSTEIKAEVPATGRTYSATVLGYNIVADVAVIQLQGASGLKAADLGSSEDLAIGDAVVALGNAGGVGGQPQRVAGAVTGLDEQITASESDGRNTQTLTELIKVDANIRSGDSGGPLVDDTGAVVGMNAAASARNGLGGFPSAGSQNEGYAIPIEKAIAIARKIIAKEGGAEIHVGANRATIGVWVPDDSASASRGGLGGRTATGAVVQDITSGSGADKAGITAGSTITAVNGVSVSSGSALTRIMVPHQPGDSVEITWTDSGGTTHRANVKLGSGPPA
jgi:S1-C subfamily serine protease